MQLHDYQIEAYEFLNERLRKSKGAALFLDPGLGKTAIVLHWLCGRMERGDPIRALIVAPLRVVHTVWPNEVKKWALSISMTLLQGPPNKRLQLLADSKTDAYCITPDLIPWLAKQTYKPFDVLIVDESTSFKTWTAKRTQSLRALLPQFGRRVILTGTPAADSYCDLHGQIYLLDDGAALGRTLWDFRQSYCYQGGYENREWLFRAACKPVVEEKIKPLSFRLNGGHYLDLPELLVNDVWVSLPGSVAAKYRQLHRQLILTLDEGETLRAQSFAQIYSMCRQVANGGIYDTDGDDRQTHHLHTAKIDAAANIVAELHGKPALVFYPFQSDLVRLRKAFPRAAAIYGGLPTGQSTEVLRAWNDGRLPVLLCQCQTVSHGLNMQGSGCADAIWIGVPDSLETYLQANARIHRQGQSNAQVRIHRILARDTVDEVIAERLDTKDMDQAKLLLRLERMLT